MKNYLIKRVMLFLLLLIGAGTIQAQIKNIPDALKRRLEGKTKLADIMIQVEDYYDHEGLADKRKYNEEESGYQHWKRWEWWMKSHLDGNGNFIRNINKANIDAILTTDARWSNSLQTARSANMQPATALSRELSASNLTGTNRPANIESAYGAWSFVGSTDDGSGTAEFKGLGRIDRIAFHPTNANVIYVGTPTGQLWKTTNGGSTWAVVTDAIGNPGVSGIAVSPTNGNVVYILTGDGDSHSAGNLVFDFGSSSECTGVFKTTDGGTTWTKTGDLYTGANDFAGRHLAISSSNGNLLLAATNQGIYRTDDGGITWDQVKTGGHWDVKFKPGNDSIVYASSGNQLFYSIHGGLAGTWVTATTDFSTSASTRINLAICETSSSYVYALCNNASTGSFVGIFRSSNSGVSYTRRCNTPNILGKLEDGSDGGDQSGYDLCIAVKPSNVSFVATGGLNVWTSNGSNGASSMIWSTKYKESYAGAANKYIHPDIHAVEYNPINDDLFAASDGGLYKSTDDGVSWTNITNGIATSQFYGMAMADTDGNGEADGISLLAGAQDNGMKHRSTFGGSVFEHVLCCDGYGAAIKGDNPDVLYMNINDYFAKSIDGGATTFGLVDPCTFFSPVAIDYTNPDTVYLGGSSTRRSYNGFSTINATIGTNTSRVITTCPSNTARIYGSSGSNVIRSDDRASTWTTKSGNTGWPSGTFTVNDIDPYPTNSLEVYVSLGGYSNGNKVMRSTNGGDDWTNWSGSLPNVPTYGLAVATEGVYIGTEIGVFFRAYSMTDWVPFYNDMPRIPVTELKVNANGLVYASTFGRGVWLSDRRSPCSQFITVSGVKNGTFYYQASVGVNTTLTSPGSSSTEIFAHAGDSVVLKPGFEVKTGAFFKGYIAPCNNGGIPTARTAASREAEINIPHLNEIKPKVKLPEIASNYFKLADGNIEISIHEKGVVSMQINNNGNWEPFYPEDIFYPGFYSLPQPESNSTNFRILLNGAEINELK